MSLSGMDSKKRRGERIKNKIGLQTKTWVKTKDNYKSIRVSLNGVLGQDIVKYICTLLLRRKYSISFDLGKFQTF